MPCKPYPFTVVICRDGHLHFMHTGEFDEEAFDTYIKPLLEENHELLRGTEWFVFRDEKIAEIRSYHCNSFLNDRENRQLHDFNYIGRGYTTED